MNRTRCKSRPRVPPIWWNRSKATRCTQSPYTSISFCFLCNVLKPRTESETYIVIEDFGEVYDKSHRGQPSRPPLPRVHTHTCFHALNKWHHNRHRRLCRRWTDADTWLQSSGATASEEPSASATCPRSDVWHWAAPPLGRKKDGASGWNIQSRCNW